MFRSQEQEIFNKLLSRHMEERDAPLLLEGGTGIGKTRAYLKSIADYSGQTAIVVPTIQLMDQLLDSEDLKAIGLEVAAFRRRNLFERHADYLTQRDRALNADVMICTSASVIIDQRLSGEYNGVTNRDYILFDEADQLPGAAALRSDTRIDKFELSAEGIAHKDSIQAITGLLSKSKLDSELRGRAKIIKEALDEPAWFWQVGLDDEGGVSLYHRMPGRLLKRIANRPNVAFISATLRIGDSFNDFSRALGIGNISRFSDVIEPASHGALNIITEFDKPLEAVIREATKPCLVATASFEATRDIGNKLPEAVLRSDTETAAAAATRVDKEGILIATGAWAGLDTPTRWASIVVPKIPFPAPTVLDEKIESRYIDSRNQAVRRMRQVIGRGLRSPDAQCDVYILDDRYQRLGAFVPERFSDSWLEGQTELVLRSERSRNRIYRKKVLEIYGLTCPVCGNKASSSAVVDVHHLYPLKEGKRKTKIEDLIALCPTCHREAHTRNPPIPIDELKEMRGHLNK